MSVLQELLLARHGIDVRVDYYDQKEEACFKSRYRNAAEIDRVAGSTVHLPLAELLTYSLFVNKRPELPGASSFSEIKANLNSSVADFDLGLRVTKSSLKTVLTGNDQVSDLSHKIGTGVALSIANRLTGLNEADWNRMTVGRSKAEDFSFASEPTGHVQVEAKGSSVKDHSGAKPPAVRQHAADIRMKFQESRGRDVVGHPVTRYGVIGSIDTREDSVMRSWLVDPPEGVLDRNPWEQQLLNRLSFVAEILDVVLPSSAFAMQLYKRIALLAQVDDVSAYDGARLSGTTESWRQAIFLTQPQDVEGNFFGTLLTLNDGTRFFYGLRTEWIDAVQSQDFARITRLGGEPFTQSLALTIPGRFEEKYEEGRRIVADKSMRPRTEVAHVHTASSGRVFGIVGQWPGRPG